MKKRALALGLLILLGLSAAAGCGGRNEVVAEDMPERGQTVTITFFGNKCEPENVTVIEQIISEFMRENPDVRVAYESLKGSDYYDALEKRIASGKGDDVFMVNHDTLLALEAGGHLADLSGLPAVDGYTPQMRSQLGEGEITWVPTTVSAFGLYCNLDLLRAHQQPVPETLGEWEAVCGYFAARGVTPIVANNDISLKTLAIGLGFWDAYRENRQAEVFARLNSGEARLSDYLEPGFALVETLIQRGYVDAREALNTKKTSDDLAVFARGESPFLLTGAWAAGRVKGMAPDLSFVVAPLPVLEDGGLLVVNPDTRLSVNAHSEHPDAAMRFVNYFTQAEQIRRFAGQQSSFSPLEGGNPVASEEIRPLAACYEAGRTVIGADDMLAIPIWELTAEAVQRMLEGEPLEAALAWMDMQAEEGRNMP